MASPSRAIAAISGQRTSRSTSGSWKPTFSGRVGLRLLDLVGLDDVAFLEVLVTLDPNAALEPSYDFLDVVLEPLQPGDLAFVDRLIVAEHLGGRATRDLAVLHPRAGDHAELRNLDWGQNVGATFPDLDEGRLVETLDGPLDVVGDVVDDVVVADVDLLPLSRFLRLLIRLHVEGDHQRVRYGRQQDVHL